MGSTHSSSPCRVLGRLSLGLGDLPEDLELTVGCQSSVHGEHPQLQPVSSLGPAITVRLTNRYKVRKTNKNSGMAIIRNLIINKTRANLCYKEGNQSGPKFSSEIYNLLCEII
jgi:hypothetical protein